MEFEDVSEKMQWEAQRVAAAFGIEELTKCTKNGKRLRDFYAGSIGATTVFCGFSEIFGTLTSIEIGKDMRVCHLFYHADEKSEHHVGKWFLYSDQPQYHELLACGLYCIGFEDPAILTQLPQLSAHEKIELRLAMPREFWLKTWLDEEAAN